MELSLDLKRYIEDLASKYKPSELREIASRISLGYLNNSGTNNHYISNEKFALTYAIMRLPATYSALNSAISHTLESIPEFKIHSVLDLGAGLGTTALVINDLMGNDVDITMVEREPSMIELGEKILTYSNINYTYIRDDMMSYVPNKKYDLIVLGYALNEFNEDEQNALISKLLLACDVLLIVEPGTPLCFSNMRKIRDTLVCSNYFVISPCMFNGKCPLKENDWCHFLTRVSRTQLHKYLKDGDAPYEDEKFFYLSISKNNVQKFKNRILRHPDINSNNIGLSLCTQNGIVYKKYFKKEKEEYKKAKKAQVGDII